MTQKRSLSGKTQGIWKFCQNTGKTQGIWFVQVVNSLNLKVTNIAKFAAKNSQLFLKLDSCKSCKLEQGKFAIRQGKPREFENSI